MKSVGLAATVLVGISFGATSSVAAVLLPRPHDINELTVGQFSALSAAANKKSKQTTDKKRKHYPDDLNFSYKELGIIPGHVPTPYGYRDCIGRWHLHNDGRIHCHGQLIRDD
jgi:hypothetical protein